jgi:preprotein translocase subunit SecD
MNTLIDYSAKYPYKSKMYSKYMTVYITPEEYAIFDFHRQYNTLLNENFDVEDEETLNVISDNFNIVEPYLRKRFKLNKSEDVMSLIEQIQEIEDERGIFDYPPMPYQNKIRNLNEITDASGKIISISNNTIYMIKYKNITTFEKLIDIVSKINNLPQNQHLTFSINNYGYTILTQLSINGISREIKTVKESKKIKLIEV